MKIALLCSGLGNVHRGHEVFAQGLFQLLRDAVDITLFKGGGTAGLREVVVDNLARNLPCLDHVHVAVSPKWREAAKEQERIRIEGETFAYGCLRPLLEGGYDVVHCLEQEVCNVIYAHRHLFAITPKVVFSNGGAIPARDLPQCDFVQEHTAHNLGFSARQKAFLIPHGVDTEQFHPGIPSDFRARHGIAEDAFVVIAVGTICYFHKRTDYVIREMASLEKVHLLLVGQENKDSAAIKALGRQLMGDRITFAQLPHSELPQAYAAADAFTLGSTFETFGIVYLEAMAMGLPVVSTNHPNQKSIVEAGIFIDMRKPGALATAFKNRSMDEWKKLGRQGREVVEAKYDLKVLARQYVEKYGEISKSKTTLPTYNLSKKLSSNTKNLARKLGGLWHKQAE